MEGPDRGLISAWLVGQELAARDSALANRAKAGELVELPFRGGVLKAIKTRNKVGHLWYVAMWQGLRGDALEVDPDGELRMTCTRFEVPVLFTMDIGKNFAQGSA